MRTFLAEEMPELFWQEIHRQSWEEHFFQEYIPDAKIVIIRTKTQANANFLARFPQLELLIRAGTGFDNIDLKEAKNRNIHVCNTPEANALAAAEHTFSLILALIKWHQIAKQNILAGKWKSGLPNCWEVSDLRVLIVGAGRVGTRVAHFLQNLGAEVKGVDPYLTKQEWQEKNIEPITYEEGLKWCNLITFHCPLTAETMDFFSETTLQHLVSPVWLINAARGGIVSDRAVREGLNNEKLLGYAADVFQPEPPEIQDFFRNENVFL
nr:NAD(P)-dependent oxidoreductase [Candidatus Cloacimonadota bacterium]